MRVVAIIPAKSESVRLPGKNMAPFGDSTLLEHKIDQLRQCELIDEVVVGSDSEAILDVARSHGASVRRRDAFHCDESRCSANQMIRDLVSRVEGELIVWAHCTNPLCPAEAYHHAILEMLRSDDHDSLCSVTEAQRHAWYAGEPLNFNPSATRHQLAAELRPVRLQDGAIFIQPRRQMLENAYFYGRSPLLYPLPWPMGLDIDTAEDLALARVLFSLGGAA